MITVRETSYEIVCATARMAPNNLYLLFLLHPAPRVPYTPTLARASTIITMRFIS